MFPYVKGTITLTAGDNRIVTVTITNEDGSAFDGTGFTPLFYVRRQGATANHLDGLTMTWKDGDPTAGIAIVRVGSIAAETTLPAGVSDFKGTYRVLNDDGTDTIWTKPGPFRLLPNEMT